MSLRFFRFLPKSCLALSCILLLSPCLSTILPDMPPAALADSAREPAQAAPIPTGGPPAPAPADRVIQLNREVISLYRQGNYEGALLRCTETCELARRELGEEHPEFGSCINNLASIYEAKGEYSQAEPLLKQSLEISKKVHGENDPDFAVSLNNLANLYSETGRYAEAEPLYLRALEIIRAGAGEDNAFFVKSLNNLASLYKWMGNYVEVEPLYKKAAEILLKMSGEDQPDYAVVINNLAQYYYLAGRYPEAVSTYQKSLDIAGKALGEKHPVYARTLSNLGSVYEATGNYSKAEMLYQQALQIFSSTSGNDSPNVAAALNNLGGLYKTIGDYGKAESFYHRSNDIWQTAVGEKHPEFAAGLNNLADLYYSTGKLDAAEQLYLKVLQIQRSSLGEKHPDVALSLQNLAVLYIKMGRYREAEPLYRQALDIWEQALGNRHPNVALALHNLASLYHNAMGRYGEAEPLYRKALEIKIAVLGRDHPDVATTLNNLAALCAATSREGEGLELMKQAQSINDHSIRQVFSFASETQRMGYIAVLRGDMDSFLSLISQYLSNSPAAVRDGLDMVLKRKAVVAEALAEQREAILGGRYPDLAPALRRLKTLNVQIAQKIMSGPGPEGPEAHRQLIEKWSAEKESLEVFLAGRIPEIDLERKLTEADRAKIAGSLPEGTALVEFVRFNLFDFKAIPAQGQSIWKPARYLAFVLLPDQPDNVRMIDLGEADPIDAMISDFRSAITGTTEKASGHADAAKDRQGAFVDVGPKLREALFDPLTKVLGDRKRLILAPDGDIYRLPFGVLPTDKGRYIIDDYHISYVGAGRDILRFGAGSAPEGAAPLVIADPDYDLEAGANVQAGEGASQERQSRDMARYASHFPRLPGTRVEGESIAAMLGVKALEGGSATKRTVEDARSPRILHIATHGFFLPDQQRPPMGKEFQTGRGMIVMPDLANPLSRGMENPLLRSGLVLAGANTWLQGKVLSREFEDGILTAQDASGLELLSTGLVVLSACQTGLGDIKVGEGVFGLRRAFLLAGAKTLVMSLWKIPDEETRMLMEGFYKRILEGMPRAEALREAQLEVKAVAAEPLYWGAFISQGDPGPLKPGK